MKYRDCILCCTNQIAAVRNQVCAIAMCMEGAIETVWMGWIQSRRADHIIRLRLRAEIEILTVDGMAS